MKSRVTILRHVGRHVATHTSKRSGKTIPTRSTVTQWRSLPGTCHAAHLKGAPCLPSHFSIQPAFFLSCLIIHLTAGAVIGLQNIVQEHYRWRNDDGSEALATWKQPADTAHTNQIRGEIIRLRFCVVNTGDGNGAIKAIIEYSTNPTGAYQPVPVAAGAAPFEITGTAGYTNQQATSDQLAGSGAFDPGKCVEDPSNAAEPCNIGPGRRLNFEYCLTPTANAVAGATYYFRLTANGQEFNQYAVYPAITIIAPSVVDNGAGAINVASDSATLRGQVTDTGGNIPETWIFWGPTDGGANKTAWSNAIGMGRQSQYFEADISGLVANKTYYYRCYATNLAGEAWAQTSTNFTTTGALIRFINTPYIIGETNAGQLVAAQPDNESALAVAVNFAASNGTAGAPNDYTPTNATLAWPAGDTTPKYFTVFINDDSDDESDETISVTMSDPVNCAVSGVNPVAITIVDNDGYPTIAFASAASQAPEEIISTNVVISLAHTWSNYVTVDYAVVSGTAEGSGGDYTLTNGTATIAQGNTTAGIAIIIVNDSLYESNETIVIVLSNPLNARLGLNTNHTYTIIDSDPKPPAVDNEKGASKITPNSATLRGQVADTGRDAPAVYICWGATNGGTNRSAWANVVAMGALDVGVFSADIAGLSSNASYYYRCYGTNSAGDAWADWSESFVAQNPPAISILANGGMETQGAVSGDAEHWTRSDTLRMFRLDERPRTELYSMRYGPNADTYLIGSASNSLRVSWNGQYADGGQNPDGGIRPGFVFSGTAHIRAREEGRVPAQFTYLLWNPDDAAYWMSNSLIHDDIVYAPVSVSNLNPMPAANVNKRHAPLLRRDSDGSSWRDGFFADDISIQAAVPRLYLQRDPANAVVFPVTLTNTYSDLQFGARCAGAGQGTVLYGAYITNPADLTNASWNAVAWAEYFDPGNAFSIVSGVTLAATNDAGWQYAVIRFSPPGLGVFTGIVRVATTDPVSHYNGGGVIHGTIVYEEYVLTGSALGFPEISNGGASNVTASSARLHGTLSSSGGEAAEVFLYWGATDCGDSRADWENVVALGAREVGPLFADVAAPASNTTYYYRFYATNSIGADWAEPTANFYASDDIDADGIPNWWEEQYGLDSRNAGDSAGDLDSDNVSSFHEYLANTSPGDSNSFMRIVAADIDGAADIRIGAWIGPNRTFAVLASDAATDPMTPVATLAAGSEGMTYWSDVNAVNETVQRFYSISVSYNGMSYTNPSEWAMHVQPRPANEKSLISAPVDCGSVQANNLNSTLGLQLARGLSASGSTNDADMIRCLSPVNTWKEYFLVTNAAGTAYWYDADIGAPADLYVSPGMALWVIRKTSPAPQPRAVFVGRSFTAQNVTPITFVTNYQGWTAFGWPLPMPSAHRNTERSNGQYSTPAGQLGFWSKGVGGTTADPKKPDMLGDQLWVWENNSWARMYWLVDNGKRDAKSMQWNGRWWDGSKGTFADFSLEPGKAYYYRHTAKRGGTNFVWRPGE